MTDKPICIVDCRDHLGEGALWDHREQVLWWVDVLVPARLHRFDPASGDHETWPMPEIVTSLAVREQGGLVIASHRTVNAFDPADGRLVPLVAPEGGIAANRSNDGAADAKGRFWLGTMQNNLEPDNSPRAITESAGSLYRIEPDLTVTKVLSGIGIANTVVWSPDRTVFYFADTLTGWIFAHDFDLETGTVSNRRAFARADDHGYPDGSTIDAEGFLWNARWGGSCVIRFAPDGAVDRIVTLPVSRVTSCAFGGPELDTLYITTSRYQLSPSEQGGEPQAGSLFAVRPGVKGLPTPRFAG